MKADFLQSCYKVASLSTCVLNAKDNPDWLYGATSQVEITNNLKAITRYEPIMSDYLSPFDYEFHIFSIDFIRDGEFLHGFAYEKKINKELNGNLTNPDLPLDTKLATLKTLQPGLRGKIESLTTTSLLTKEEEQALIKKGISMQEEADKLLELDSYFANNQSTQEESKTSQK